MQTYFSVRFEPVAGSQEQFQPKLMGYSSDPLLAMAGLAIAKIAEDGDPLPCILYERDGLPIDFFSEGNTIDLCGKRAGNESFPLGVKSEGQCIFLHERMQEVYDSLFGNLATRNHNPPVSEALRRKWYNALRNENEVLRQFISSSVNPSTNQSNPPPQTIGT